MRSKTYDARKWKILQIQQSGAAFTLIALAACTGCAANHSSTEFPARYDNYSPQSIALVPVIFEGLVVANASPIGDFQPSRINGHGPTRRWRARVRVENVLQGDVPHEEVDIFYFIGTDNLGSSDSTLNLPAGARRIFFLQRDGGELRLIHDGWESSVVKVLSGAHHFFKRDPHKPATDAIVDLLLTRGEGAKDKDMIEAIYWVAGLPDKFGNEAVIKKLQQLAREETPPIRAEACYFLAERKPFCEGVVGKEQFRNLN